MIFATLDYLNYVRRTGRYGDSQRDGGMALAFLGGVPEYEQPTLLPSEEFKGIPQTLIYVPADKKVRDHIVKREAIEILRCIYLDLYADCYTDDPELDREYRHYLQGLFKRCQQELPEIVALKPLHRRNYVRLARSPVVGAAQMLSNN